MLRCIFGKCSTETYVVTKETSRSSTNGVIKSYIDPENGQATLESHSRINTRQQVTTPEPTQNGHAIRVAEETTQSHTTQSQTTQSHTTQSETTGSHATQSPTTQSRTTQSETTQSPTLQSETTGSHATQSPTIQLETTQSRTTQSETAQSPTIQSETTRLHTTQSWTIQSETTRSHTTPSPTIQLETTQSETAQSPTIQSETTGLHTTQSSTIQSETTQSPTTQSQVTQSQPTQSQTTQSQTTRSQTPEISTSDKEEQRFKSDDNVTTETVTETQVKPKPKAPQPPRPKSDVNEASDSRSTAQNEQEQETSDSAASSGTSKKAIAAGAKETKRGDNEDSTEVAQATKRRSGIQPLPVSYDEGAKIKIKSHRKTEDEETLIRRAIEENDFLNKIIVKRRLEDVVKAMYKKEVAAKEIVVKQGEKGSHMYISEKGKFQVLIKNKVVSEFNDVRVFGELAILYNAKRLATIKALTPGKVWVLDRNVFQQIIVGYYIKEQDEILQFLLNNDVLKEAGKPALQEVANLLKSEFFKSGTQIVRQGDKGYQFYIIRAGTVTITKDGEGVVGHLDKGKCFGELALLKEDCRQATVTADAPGVECLTLTRKEFIEHFGEVEALSNLTVQPKSSFGVGMAEYEDLILSDLKIIKTLGVGGFGRVELVQHKKKSDLVFALKYLKKIDIVMQHQQEHVYNEKNIQMNCRSPFIVRLYRTYKDNKYIYLLMESCLGGDLWSLLQKQKQRRFEEKDARFIAGCVLESFEYLHSRGIIYRDLKPENLLIAANGYIKLTDFGFAKKISSRGKTFTFAGTPEYVAPEIVLNRGHDRSVDYWAFGAFIFELLTGRTPFRTDDSSHMKTYNKILNGIDNVSFPSYINLKARHIVEKLCRPVPSERLGMQRGGIQDIKAHKWFLGFDWQKFAKCEMPSPFKPKLKSPIDTQYFDQFKKDTDVPPDEDSGWDKQF